MMFVSFLLYKTRTCVLFGILVLIEGVLYIRKKYFVYKCFIYLQVCACVLYTNMDVYVLEQRAK